MRARLVVNNTVSLPRHESRWEEILDRITLGMMERDVFKLDVLLGKLGSTETT